MTNKVTGFNEIDLPPLTEDQRAVLEKLAQAAPVLDDMPELTVEELAQMRPATHFRPIKQQITARVDADVLSWLKSQGKGYQSRLNAILRRAMLAEQSQKPRSNPLPRK